MTIKLDLTSVYAYANVAWLWIQSHPYHVVGIWYALAYLVVRCANHYSKEEYDLAVVKKKSPYEAAFFAWLFSPVIFVLAIFLFVFSGLVKVEEKTGGHV